MDSDDDTHGSEDGGDNSNPSSGRRDRDTDTFSVRSTRSWHSVKDPFTLRSTSSSYPDRVVIHDWKSPVPSNIPSTHDEETQLEALQKHAASLKADLDKHNALRTPMQQLVSLSSFFFPSFL